MIAGSWRESPDLQVRDVIVSASRLPFPSGSGVFPRFETNGRTDVEFYEDQRKVTLPAAGSEDIAQVTALMERYLDFSVREVDGVGIYCGVWERG